MNPLVLQYLTTALQLLPGVVAAGANLAAEAEALSASISAMQAENRDPTPAEWAAQNARLAASVKALLAQPQGRQQ